jgi:hypothetical protein
MAERLRGSNIADEPVAVGEYLFEGRQYLYIGEIRTEDDFDEEKREERTMGMVEVAKSQNLGCLIGGPKRAEGRLVDESW